MSLRLRLKASKTLNKNQKNFAENIISAIAIAWLDVKRGLLKSKFCLVGKIRAASLSDVFENYGSLNV